MPSVCSGMNFHGFPILCIFSCSCLDDVELINHLKADRNLDCPHMTSWEKVMARAEMMVWRRRMDATYLYEYKGTFKLSKSYRNHTKIVLGKKILNNKTCFTFDTTLY